MKPEHATRGPYDLDAEEIAAAEKEAAEFIATLRDWSIPPGHGTYRQKRLGLGVNLLGVDVDCSKKPYVVVPRYVVHAWRTAGEERFGDSIK